MLIYTTIVVLGQEPLRRASLSNSADPRLHWRKVINLFWISFPLVILLAMATAAGWAFLLRFVKMSSKMEEWTVIRRACMYHYDIPKNAFFPRISAPPTRKAR